MYLRRLAVYEMVVEVAIFAVWEGEGVLLL
jgi:hypothetical protein